MLSKLHHKPAGETGLTQAVLNLLALLWGEHIALLSLVELQFSLTRHTVLHGRSAVIHLENENHCMDYCKFFHLLHRSKIQTLESSVIRGWWLT